ncbi:hypothetical protein C8024_04120 [Sphingopyxis sp. BSNA05]|uniref:DUF11 domain-containing protein n=1 Tax=Sphingopyxis sp. BSNA05 TaxID=1236614 RepID=UPI0015662E18|nr:DUF11 domain-containing protein [Sphingopyxis sp. BSNA05]NRD88815.1 hypothetical protein [Sphingopyxis sp. BSNA05]
MTSILKLLVATSTISVAALGANPAFAADLGTDAGTSITNTVSVAYNVGGTGQTAETDSDVFVVDRKVNLVLAKSDSVNTSVAPNATQQAVTYTVSNQTNDTIDVLLSAEQPATDDFDVTGTLTYYLDNGTTAGVFDGSDTLITYIDNLGEDSSVTIHVVANIPSGVVTGNLSDVILIGQAAAHGGSGLPATGSGVQGLAFSNDSGDADDTSVVQNVFADAAGTGSSDGAGDGYHSATDTYEVSAADITVTKTSSVLWDPVNGSTNPKAIPGAIVEYCIAVANASGGAAATGVAISDTIPANLAYYSSLATGPATVPAVIGVVTEGTVTGSICNADGTGTGAEASGVVSGNLGTVASGATETLVFRVTVE